MSFSFVLTVNDDGTVTASALTLDGSHASEPQQHAQAVQAVQQVVPNATVVEDPWAGTDATPAPPQASTVASYPAQQATPTQAAYGTKPTSQGGQYAQPATVAAQPPQQGPACQHGPLKVIPGGYSQAKQKNYAAFWVCSAPRGQQCRLDQRQLPPVPTQ